MALNLMKAPNLNMLYLRDEPARFVSKFGISALVIKPSVICLQEMAPLGFALSQR